MLILHSRQLVGLNLKRPELVSVPHIFLHLFLVDQSEFTWDKLVVLRRHRDAERR